METPNGPKPQEGQAMTADEREEARLVRILDMLDNLHVWVRDSHSPRHPQHLLTPCKASELRTTIPRMTEPLKTARNCRIQYCGTPLQSLLTRR